MHSPVFRFALLAIALGICNAPAAIAQSDSGQAAPDNTKTNKRDRSQDQPTADQQKENSADRQVSQKIRTAIMQDKTLSTYGHNVKVVTQNGQVTLKGPVRTQEEKDAIGEKAISIAGEGHVTNQLEVAPKKQ